MENTGISKFLVPAAVVLAGLFIGGAVIWNGSHPSGTGGTTGTGTGQTAQVNISNVKTDGEPYVGNPNAPVTIAEWSDYQCPFCQEWEATTLPQIVQNYVNSGQVKIVFKDFPFLWAGSMDDAEYGRAVWQLYPQQFFAWRTAMYQTQPPESDESQPNAQANNLAWIQKTTGSISGIDLQKVEAAVTANKTTYDAAINADKAEGTSFGINATPSFIIGTQLIQGAYPYSNFASAIQAAMK